MQTLASLQYSPKPHCAGHGVPGAGAAAQEPHVAVDATLQKPLRHWDAFAHGAPLGSLPTEGAHCVGGLIEPRNALQSQVGSAPMHPRIPAAVSPDDGAMALLMH
jgi:hypothetical protein